MRLRVTVHSPPVDGPAVPPVEGPVMKVGDRLGMMAGREVTRIVRCRKGDKVDTYVSGFPRPIAIQIGTRVWVDR